MQRAAAMKNSGQMGVDYAFGTMKAKDARIIRAGRQRVCVECLRQSDEMLGTVHSELPCERCGAEPCVGYIVSR